MSNIKKRASKCKSVACHWGVAEGQTHCSSCMQGKPVQDSLEITMKCKKFKYKVNKFVNKITASDELVNSFKNGSVVGFLRNLSQYERLTSNKLMFKAKQVSDLMQGYQSCSVYSHNQPKSSISFHDKILVRVPDWWNLVQPDFCGTIHCYWGYYGDEKDILAFNKIRKRLWDKMVRTFDYCDKIQTHMHLLDEFFRICHS